MAFSWRFGVFGKRRPGARAGVFDGAAVCFDSAAARFGENGQIREPPHLVCLSWAFLGGRGNRPRRNATGWQKSGLSSCQAGPCEMAASRR